MPELQNAKILIMSSDGFEQFELFVPLEKLKETGATVHGATPDDLLAFVDKIIEEVREGEHERESAAV